ncbi:MAG: hypothetical protein HYT87_11995 [Nitrospirae bacterium]|nr:hypothetical protein [Nitrospirota bacterium]
MTVRGIAVSALAVLALGPACNEKNCEEIPAAAFGKPTSLAFSKDGARLFVVNGNGDRRYCQAFLSLLKVSPDDPATLAWDRQVALPGLPGDLRASSDPDQLLVPTLLDEGDIVSGKLLILGPDATVSQSIPTSRGPFWTTLVQSTGSDPRLLLSSLPDQKVDLLRSKSGTWEIEETILLNSALFRSGPVNIGAGGLPLPERTALHAHADRSWLLIADSAIYAFPLGEGKTTPRGVLWIYPLDPRDQLFWAFVGLRPRSIAVDESRSIAYVTNLGGSTARGDISLVDLTPPTDDSRTFFTLNLGSTQTAPQGIVPASGSSPYELLLADDGDTLFVSDLRAPRVYEIDLTPFHASLRETGSSTLQQWSELIADRGENSVDYFPAATPHSFPGRGAAFLAYHAASRRLAVSDPSGDRIEIFSRTTTAGAHLP